VADYDVQLSARLKELVEAFRAAAPDVAVFLVYDRPDRVDQRPGFARSFFAERCVSDAQLDATVAALRRAGAYVELFPGEMPFLEALVSGRLSSIDRPTKLVYNGIEGSIAHDAFRPGRKALLPAVADSYSILCSNSDAHSCSVGRHKFHYYRLLSSLGIAVPPVWHYRPGHGWAGNQAPTRGLRVIAKSTYESWSVGVTSDSVFSVDDSCQERVAEIAREIGQAVCVQEFVAGPEVHVPVLSLPDRWTCPPMQAVLAKAPNDAAAVMTIDDNLASGAIFYHRFEGDDETQRRIRTAAVDTFDGLQLGAFARVDFRVASDGVPWVIDVGVSPGISEASSAFASIQVLGFDHEEFLQIVVASTLAEQSTLPSFPARTRFPAS
jgi:D-alanine-D-alanine ligase